MKWKLINSVDSLLQHLEHRLAELQRLKSASVDADDHGSVNEVREADVAHDVAAQVASISITNNLSLSLFQGSAILPHKSKLFYPSERPPLKIPIRGIYHEVNPRTAGEAYASQFSSFNSQHVPLNVMERLFRNYTEEILPRFPCFSEAELVYHFNHTCINSAKPGLSRVQDALSRFVISMTMAISALNSKNQDFRKVAALSEALHADAMKYVDDLLHECSISALQCLILLIQLALLLPQTSNLWYLTGDAMRMAVSLGLHQEPEPRIFRDRAHAEQRRRIFWVVYQLDRIVSVSGGCPVALSDEHITTRLPYDFGDVSDLAERADSKRVSTPKERQFLLDLHVCIMKSEIQATQFFDRPVPSYFGSHDDWVQQMDVRTRNLSHDVSAHGNPHSSLVASCLQCQIMLHRPCSRNIAVSETSLVSVVNAAIELIALDAKAAESGGLVMVFEISNRMFQAGMLLLYALRNHATKLQRASLADIATASLKNLSVLLTNLSSRWPPLYDTASYINELIETNLRNPLGHNGSHYDMQVLEELDCLVTQRRIHSIRHRNIPFPPPKKPTPSPSEPENIARDFLNDEQWWTDFIDQDFVTNESCFSLPSGGGQAAPSPSSEPNETRVERRRDIIDNNASDLEKELDVILDAIPSCSFCRDRRTKCQRQLPACKECARTSRECFIFDPILKANIPLRRVQLLIEELKVLAKQVPSPSRSSNNTQQPSASGNPLFLPLQRGASPLSEAASCISLSSTVFFGSWSSLGCLRDQLQHKASYKLPSTVCTATRNTIPTFSFQSLVSFQSLPESLAAPIFNLFSRSINTFFPIFQPQTLDIILIAYYHPNATPSRPHNTPLFNLIIALGAQISSKTTPSLFALAEHHFQNAISFLPITCAHASRTENVSLLQRTLLICVYTLLEPRAGDVWRHLGFAIRLFLDLSHRPSMEEDEDHGLFCMLTRTLYTLESHVSIAFGRPSLLVIGDDLRRELVEKSGNSLQDEISTSSYQVSLLKMQIHSTILVRERNTSVIHETQPLRDICETYRQSLDSWFARWKEITTSISSTCSIPSSIPWSHALQETLLSWGSLHYYHGMSLVTTLWPTPGGDPSTICGSVSKAGLQLVRHQQLFANLTCEGAPSGEGDVVVFPCEWTMAHLVLQVGLRAMGEKDKPIVGEKNEDPSLALCFSLLLLLEADDSKLLRGLSSVCERLSENVSLRQ
ncbi:hypothetical protein CTAM01_08210 [Colletotrichum tamarilloi]|uniref:Zn(2)-C6 fungal-type domain-containing protein n=1 Tax=Colletotrichum tamarilloi TaxID=1209934 RepID=A0ABQ9R6L9_9PEZI|nr:uncharacterized protein CTAM01_08210 [Colletotrichum tamarilloi]KAK1496572.1 hypothetical protein CTAM01_08210 [Colletotrichum tamarilloi]